MKITLQEKLNRYKRTISQQALDPSKIKKIGLTSAAAMAAIVSAPVELSSQVVCGNQGTPTRTIGPCTGDLDPLNGYNCARFDFDGDGINELQIYYYNFSGIYPAASMYIDPIQGTEKWEVYLGAYVSFPQYAVANNNAYDTHYADKIHFVPLSSGAGYGFIAFDADAWPWNNGIDAHPNTGQLICCWDSALPTMWGGNDGLVLADITINAYSDVTDCIAPLPVKLSKFEARATPNSIMLEWSTESEINNSGFEIERSVDGVKFTDITFVEGNNDSQRKNSYVYEDKTAIKGQEYYYRLKQIDFDGKTEYSDVRFATVASDEFEFSIAPNPAQDNVVVDLIGYQDEDVLIEIYTISGSLVLSENRRVGEDTSMSLDISDLSGAMYFIKITDSNVSKYKKLLVSK